MLGIPGQWLLSEGRGHPGAIRAHQSRRRTALRGSSPSLCLVPRARSPAGVLGHSADGGFPTMQTRVRRCWPVGAPASVPGALAPVVQWQPWGHRLTGGTSVVGCIWSAVLPAAGSPCGSLVPGSFSPWAPMSGATPPRPSPRAQRTGGGSRFRARLCLRVFQDRCAFLTALAHPLGACPLLPAEADAQLGDAPPPWTPHSCRCCRPAERRRGSRPRPLLRVVRVLTPP